MSNETRNTLSVVLALIVFVLSCFLLVASAFGTIDDIVDPKSTLTEDEVWLTIDALSTEMEDIKSTVNAATPTPLANSWMYRKAQGKE